MLMFLLLISFFSFFCCCCCCCYKFVVFRSVSETEKCTISSSNVTAMYYVSPAVAALPTVLFIIETTRKEWQQGKKRVCVENEARHFNWWKVKRTHFSQGETFFIKEKSFLFQIYANTINKLTTPRATLNQILWYYILHGHLIHSFLTNFHINSGVILLVYSFFNLATTFLVTQQANKCCPYFCCSPLLSPLLTFFSWRVCSCSWWRRRRRRRRRSRRQTRNRNRIRSCWCVPLSILNSYVDCMYYTYIIVRFRLAGIPVVRRNCS